MKEEWYYSKGGQQQGPVSAGDLKALAGNGTLKPSDLIWKEGMAEWKPASSVKALFPGPDASSSSSPPPLPQAQSAVSGSPIQRVVQWFTFGSSLPQPLPFDTPWEPEERTKPKQSDLYCAIAAIPVAAITLLSLPVVLLFPPAFAFTLFMGAILGSLLFGKKLWGVSGYVRGRWVDAENAERWVEFGEDGTFRRSDGTSGKWTLLSNGRFIDLAEARTVVDSWKVLDSSLSSLEVQDRSGAVQSFKRGKTLAQREAEKALGKLNIFKTSRPKMLIAVWQYAENSEHWCQFTDDGAVVTSQGPAGRYSFSGEQPNEVISMELADGRSNSWKVVSLTQTQLVVAEDGQTMILRKSGAPKAASGASQSSGVLEPDGANQSEGGSGEGFLSKVWSFMTKHKCPKCNQRAGVETNREPIDRWQDFRSVPVKGADGQYRQVQKAVNHTVYRYHCQCKSCSHQWNFDKTQSVIA